MDFLRNMRVRMYGDAHRKRLDPGSVRYTSNRSHATGAGMIFRMNGRTGSRNLYRHSVECGRKKCDGLCASRTEGSVAPAEVLKDPRYRPFAACAPAVSRS